MDKILNLIESVSEGFPSYSYGPEMNKNINQGSELENEAKQGRHSCMRHSALTSSTILQSIIKTFQKVTERQARNYVQKWIRGGN